ncbi:MAG: DUF4381 domain-containing protein [Pseudomonadota bacterium]
MSERFDGLSLVGLIDLLEPAPVPAPVSMWPQTVGWIWLAFALLALFVGLAWRIRAWHHANAYRRAALKALDAAGDAPEDIAAILRRTALATFPRAEVAGITGRAWLTFLDQSYGGTGFSQGPGQILAEAAYRPCPPAPELKPLARDWIRRHKSGARA